MHFSLLLGLGGALLSSARPLGSGSIVKRSLTQCANDAVWLQLQESSLQAQASAFCSAYIEQTATQIVTVYPTTTAGTATITDTITVDITVTDTSNIIDTVTSWYFSSDIAPVTITSVIEDVVQTTDFITTTDATVIITAIDVVTTTVTDTTLTSTVVSTDDITTTDTTVYATQTATMSMTITDSTVINTVTSVQTATVTLAQRTVDVETLDDQEEEEEEFDDCGEPEPECTSSECLFSSWLAEVSTIATSDLSSACSCLVVPATTTTTIVTTASQSTAPSIFVTATSRVTAYQTQVSSRHVVVSASTIIDETSSIPLFVTRTRTTPTTKYVYATASSSATVTRVATNDQTASTRVTSVESVTIDETASATTTITATATILETASSTVSMTETTTATITPTACAQLSSPYHNSAYGAEVYIDCNYEYSYSASKVVGLDLYVTFIECVNACAALSTCSYLQYDRSEYECFLLSGVLSGQAESGVDVAVVSR